MKEIVFKSYRNESRNNYGIHTSEGINLEQINTGCLQRIADSVESMSKGYVNLEKQLKSALNDSEYYKAELTKQLHVNAGLKGYINRLKKKL